MCVIFCFGGGRGRHFFVLGGVGGVVEVEVWPIFSYVSHKISVHFLSNSFKTCLQINSKDMRSCRHEDAVGMLTGGLSSVTLILYREKVINKRMNTCIQATGQSMANKIRLIKNEVRN